MTPVSTPFCLDVQSLAQVGPCLIRIPQTQFSAGTESAEE
jgi:hypothetical protein